MENGRSLGTRRPRAVVRTSRQAADMQNRPRAWEAALGPRPGGEASSPAAAPPRGGEGRREAGGWGRGADSGEDAPGVCVGPSSLRPATALCTAGRNPTAGQGRPPAPGAAGRRRRRSSTAPRTMLTTWGARESSWWGEPRKRGPTSLPSWHARSARKQQGVERSERFTDDLAAHQDERPSWEHYNIQQYPETHHARQPVSTHQTYK